MFSKLLKYEWKANASLLTILSLAALGAGVLGGVLLRVMMNISEMSRNNESRALGVAGLGIMFFFVILALIAYVIAVEFITISRFYKNKFTDEGYLTFTLPVKVRQIFLSSFLNILIWILIAIVVLLTSMSLILIIGIKDYLGDAMTGLTNALQLIRGEMSGYPGYGLYQVLTVLQLVVSPVYATILIMCCVTVGSVLAKKHKVLTAIGIYYGANMALNIITSILTAVPQILLLSSMENYEQNYYVYTNISQGITLVLQILVVAVGYFLSVGLMKRKLNLS